MKKSILSLLSASIISMSLVGCQSTQSLEDYLSNNVDETIWVLKEDSDGYVEGTIDDWITLYEDDSSTIYEDLDNLRSYNSVLYDEYVKAVINKDLKALENLYKNNAKVDTHTNTLYIPKGDLEILQTTQFATNYFTTFDYIGLNANFLRNFIPNSSDDEIIKRLEEVSISNEPNIKYDEVTYALNYARFHIVYNILNDSVEGIYLCCSCGSTKTNQFFSIINDYMCSDCSSHVQCYDCGNNYNINSMNSFNGRSFHCGCKEEEIMVNTEQEALITEGTCGDCGTTNIDIMDNAGGYLCNECGHIGTINID